MALLQDHHRQPAGSQNGNEPIDRMVAKVTASIGTILVPMIQMISSLEAAAV
jgi:hypothetical protein